jgi:DNA-binding transcriptional ArsR family regulator
MNDSQLDQTFFALSDPSRRELLQLLAGGPQTVNALAEPFDISRPAISRHLRVLREAGLVTVRLEGRERWHSLEVETLEEANVWFQQFWRAALRSLKAHVEGSQESGKERGR